MVSQNGRRHCMVQYSDGDAHIGDVRRRKYKDGGITKRFSNLLVQILGNQGHMHGTRRNFRTFALR